MNWITLIGSLLVNETICDRSLAEPGWEREGGARINTLPEIGSSVLILAPPSLSPRPRARRSRGAYRIRVFRVIRGPV